MVTRSCNNPSQPSSIFNPSWTNLHYYGLEIKKQSELYPQSKVNTIITDDDNN